LFDAGDDKRVLLLCNLRRNAVAVCSDQIDSIIWFRLRCDPHPTHNIQDPVLCFSEIVLFGTREIEQQEVDGVVLIEQLMCVSIHVMPSKVYSLKKRVRSNKNALNQSTERNKEGKQKQTPENGLDVTRRKINIHQINTISSLDLLSSISLLLLRS